MTAPFTAACVQFTAGPDPEPNLREVAGLVRRARDAGADSIMTPEASNLIESGKRRRDKGPGSFAGLMSRARREFEHRVLTLPRVNAIAWDVLKNSRGPVEIRTCRETAAPGAGPSYCLAANTCPRASIGTA